MWPYIKLLRPKNWIKNVLIFIPFIFAVKFVAFIKSDYINLFLGFCSFSLLSSVIYIINDIMDIESDKNDAYKKYRPLPSGKVSMYGALIEAFLVLSMSVALTIVIGNIKVYILLFAYFIMNIAYSVSLKHMPVIDITLLSMFFLIRIYYGAALVDVPVSIYLSLTTVTAAYYLGISKRLNEYKSNSAIRPVLEKYDTSYLKDLSVMFQTLTITFYALWVVNYTGPLDVNMLRITILMVIVILIYYKHIIIESDLSNPVDIVYSHKTLLFFIAMYILLILASMFPKFVTDLYFGCG